MDEEFRGEDSIDEEGLNATQQRVAEEGTVWHDVDGNPTRGDELEDPEGEGQAQP